MDGNLLSYAFGSSRELEIITGSIFLKPEIISQIVQGNESNHVMNCIVNCRILKFSYKNKKYLKIKKEKMNYS